jgi:membrane protein
MGVSQVSTALDTLSTARPVSAVRLFLQDLASLFRPRVLARLWRKCAEDDIGGMAVEVTYFTLFALFPFLLFVASLVGLLVQEPERAIAATIAQLHRLLPARTAELLGAFLSTTLRSNRPDLLSVGALGTLWAGSQGLHVLIKALNRIYGTRETRGWVRARMVAVLMMMGAALVFIALLVVLIGADPGGLLSRWLAFPPQVVATWAELRWPVAFMLLTVVLALVYCTGPCRRIQWRWITPGGLIATLLWLAASAGFTAFLDWFGSYDTTYGTLAGVMVSLTWIHVGAFLMLLGAEINVVIVQEGRQLEIPVTTSASGGGAAA